jgi:hypothetical protein
VIAGTATVARLFAVFPRSFRTRRPVRCPVVSFRFPATRLTEARTCRSLSSRSRSSQVSAAASPTRRPVVSRVSHRVPCGSSTAAASSWAASWWVSGSTSCGCRRGAATRDSGLLASSSSRTASLRIIRRTPCMICTERAERGRPWAEVSPCFLMKNVSRMRLSSWSRRQPPSSGSRWSRKVSSYERRLLSASSSRWTLRSMPASHSVP